MRVAFRLVDVFTDRPLTGNQLCVVPDARGLSPEVMQALALEMGFSETTFVTRAEGDRYAMRIFTPTAELPFAGHPTLGTAFVLAKEGRVRTPVTQSVAAGEFRIAVDVAAGTARMEQLPPDFRPPVEDLDGVAEAAGVSAEGLHPDLPPQVVSTGLEHLLVAASSEQVVEQATPDLRRLVQVLDRTGGAGLYLFAVGEGRVKARLFAPAVGLPEDPATGSAAGPLGAYLVEHGAFPPGHMTISQGAEIGRPGTLEVDVEQGESGWRVFVSGGVVVVGEGVFGLAE